MLTIQDLHVFHGPIEAVHGISLAVDRGKCISLLGPNGAGKTSTISAITGIARATGSIRFEDREISGDSVEARIASGIAVSPEGRRVFSNLTILENLTLGAALQKDKSEQGR
ncbi:MAG: ATP-binding cassette domain-containing protein, partial [Pseudomonadota bacterium]